MLWLHMTERVERFAKLLEHQILPNSFRVVGFLRFLGYDITTPSELLDLPLKTRIQLRTHVSDFMRKITSEVDDVRTLRGRLHQQFASWTQPQVDAPWL